MVDPATKVPMFEPDEIKSAAVNYVKDLLQNQFLSKDYERFYYLQEMIHFVRCHDAESNEIITNKAFEDRLGIISKKCPEKYKFIINSGEAFKNCIFKLLRRCGHRKANPSSGRTQWWFNCTREKENHQNFQTRETSIQRKPFQNSLKGLLLICQKKNSYKDVLSFKLGESQGTDPKNIFSR